jgi:sulfite exporter TauE/SafE
MGFKLLYEGLGLGLTTGTLCMITCAPIYISALLQKEQDFKKATFAILQMSLGRFISYAAFGALTGSIGAMTTQYFDKDYFVIASYILISGYLIYSAFIQGKKEKGMCPAKKYSNSAANPLLLGLLTGISLCPSFALALTRAFDTGGATGGVMLFSGFFVGTTLYFIPFSFLSFLTKKKIFRVIGIITSIFVAVYFTFQAGTKAFDKYNRFTIDFAQSDIVLINNTKNKFAIKVKQTFKVQKIISTQNSSLAGLHKEIPSHSKVLLLTDATPSEDTMKNFKEKKLHVSYALIDNKMKNFEWIHNFLSKNLLLGRKTTGFFYKIPYHDHNHDKIKFQNIKIKAQASN